jgi:glycosyltransferase involved in cell wall biosynthesis
MLEHITPVILTYNEVPNIARTLSHLFWAEDVVVVDSGSTDGTLGILARWPKVRIFSRPFDTHAEQWRYAVADTGILTPWILRLDADYQLTNELIEEIRGLNPADDVDAYSIAFDYAIFAQKLRASLYPRNTLLLRRGRFKLKDNGHTESWIVEGPVRSLSARVIHDDRKGTQSWINAQSRYMNIELEKISTDKRRLRDRLRLVPPLMPIAVFLYCLFGKGLIFNGRAGLFYALQRLSAEAVLSLMVLERSLRAKIELEGRQVDAKTNQVEVIEPANVPQGENDFTVKKRQ